MNTFWNIICILIILIAALFIVPILVVFAIKYMQKYLDWIVDKIFGE